MFSICIQDIHWILSNATKTASSSQIWKENTCSSSFAIWPEVKIVVSFNTLHYHCNRIAPPVVHHHYHDFALSKYRQSHGMACYTLNPNKINLATINSIRQFRIWKMWKFWTLDKYIFSLRQIPFVNWTECFFVGPSLKLPLCEEMSLVKRKLPNKNLNWSPIHLEFLKIENTQKLNWSGIRLQQQKQSTKTSPENLPFMFIKIITTTIILFLWIYKYQTNID